MSGYLSVTIYFTIGSKMAAFLFLKISFKVVTEYKHDNIHVHMECFSDSISLLTKMEAIPLFQTHNLDIVGAIDFELYYPCRIVHHSIYMYGQ